MQHAPIFKAIRDIREFLELDTQKRHAYLYEPHRWFIRESPLLFSRTVLLVLGLLRNSLSIELFDFFGRLKMDSVTKSALCQRRQLIKPAFFRDLFVVTADVFYKRFKAKRWKGFWLIAIDGTGFRLPEDNDIGESYGWHGNQHNRVPSTRALIAFDVLNKIIYDVEHHPREVSEVKVNYAWIPDFPKDFLAVYDRGFASYAIPLLHLRYGSNCIVRLRTDVSPVVKQFIQSTDKERHINVSPKHKCRRTVAQQGVRIDHDEFVKVRLLKILLPTGEVEILMTTLCDKRKYPHRFFAGLYNARWGVETAIFCIKSYGKLTAFSSYKPEGIEQDIWAQYAMYNIQSMMITSQEDEVKKVSQKRKYPATINRNVTLGLIKRNLTYVFLDPMRKWKARLLVLLDKMTHHLEAKRPRPSRPRNRKILRGQGRHIYESNYKPTL